VTRAHLVKERKPQPHHYENLETLSFYTGLCSPSVLISSDSQQEFNVNGYAPSVIFFILQGAAVLH
jgi:hypothetical protein